MEFPRHIRTLVRTFGIVKLAGAAFAAAETPPSTPAPRPGTLAAYASSVTLARDPDLGALIITTDNLTELGRDGALTVSAISIFPVMMLLLKIRMLAPRTIRPTDYSLGFESPTHNHPGFLRGGRSVVLRR